MKKNIILASLLLIFTLGCEKVSFGDYKEGTYFGYSEYESYGKNYVTTAIIYVNSDGVIKNCFIDSTYIKDNKITTKKTLKDDYGMKAVSESMGVIQGGAEWYEQVEKIEQKVIEEQGIEWAKLNDKNKLDTISGVTITADSYIEALEKAIEQAK